MRLDLNPTCPRHRSVFPLLGTASCLLSAGLILAASMAVADMRVLSETKLDDGAWQFKITYESRAAAPTIVPAEYVPLVDPISGEMQSVLTESRTIDLGVESLLLALPVGASPDAATWQMESVVGRFADGSLNEGAMGAAAVQVTAAQVGAFQALQLVVDPSKGQDASGAARRLDKVDIVLTLPPASARARASMTDAASRVVADIDANAVAAATFANPGSALAQLADSPRPDTSRAVAGPRRQASIPAPAGSHRVTYAEGDQLLRVPMATIGASAGTITQLGISHHGTILPRGGVLGTDVWFFAPRRNTSAAQNDSVFTSVGVNPSPTMATRNAYTTLPASVAPVEIAVPRTRRWDQYQRLYARRNMDNSLARPIYERSLDLPLGERFPFHRVQNPNSSTVASSYSYQLPILDVVTNGNVTLLVGFNGINQVPESNPDHFANITLAGTALPQYTWEGIADLKEQIYNLNFGAIPPGPNWTITHSVPTPPFFPSSDIQNLAFVELSWTGKPRVIGNRRGDLVLSAAAQPRLVTMGGFPAGTTVGQIYLLDVTEPTEPVRLDNPTLFTDGSGGIGIEFEAPATACRFYVERVTTNSDIASPAFTGLSETLPEALPDGVALRSIYVRQSTLASALQPLINQRGPGILTLEPQAAYNVFGGGQQSPEALRDALRTLLEEAPLRVAVPSILLVGHGSYDRPNYLNLQTYPQVTFFLDESERFNGFTIEKSVDYPYAMLFGPDSLPDVMVGRLPVRDATDLTMAVNRMLAHDAATATLAINTRPALFIADNKAVPDDPLFIADQPALVALWATNGRPNRRMEINQPSADLGGLTNNAAVKAGLEEKGPGATNRGMSFVFYVGHGENNTWAGEQIATSSDTSLPSFLGQFDTLNQWPIVATFTCLNGNYALPVPTPVPPATGRTMVEAWLFNSNRGAAACIAPASVETYGVVRLLQDEFVGILGEADQNVRPATVGTAWFQSQVAFLEKYPSLTSTLREYSLFGDPETLTMVVPYSPDLRVTMASLPTVVQPNSIVTIYATATNVGTIEARDVETLVTLPASVTYLASTQAFGTNLPNGQNVVFNFGTLRPGESATGAVIGLVGGAPPSESFATGVVSSDFADPDPVNNSASIGIGTTYNNYLAIY